MTINIYTNYALAVLYINIQIMILIYTGKRKIMFKDIVWANCRYKWIRLVELISLIIFFAFVLLYIFQANHREFYKVITWMICIVTFFVFFKITNYVKVKSSGEQRKLHKIKQKLVNINDTTIFGIIEYLAFSQPALIFTIYVYKLQFNIEMLVAVLAGMLISFLTAELLKCTYKRLKKVFGKNEKGMNDAIHSLINVFGIMFLLLLLLIISIFIKQIELDVIIAVECIFNFIISFTYFVISFLRDKEILLGLNINYKYAVCIISIIMGLIIYLLEEQEFHELWGIALLSLIIGWFTLMYMLLKIVFRKEIKKDPNIKLSKKGKERFIVLNLVYAIGILFFMILLCDRADAHKAFDMGEAFQDENKFKYFFKLFYYLIISFSTIGYGDITPISGKAMFISILISITSVIYLIMFINSVMTDD